MLASCGWVFTPEDSYDNATRCVYCGVLHRNWKIGDNLTTLHKQKSPECSRFKTLCWGSTNAHTNNNWSDDPSRPLNLSRGWGVADDPSSLNTPA
jgi:hypothetical protein